MKAKLTNEGELDLDEEEGKEKRTFGRLGNEKVSLKEKLINSTLKEFESLEDLEVEVMANDKSICQLFGKYQDLEIKYAKLKTAVVAIGRKFGVEFIIDEDDEVGMMLDRIVNGKNGRKWTTLEELNEDYQ